MSKQSQVKTGTWIQGADVQQLLRTLKFLFSRKIGNYFMIRTRKGTPEDWADLGRFCRNNRIYFCLIDTQPRGMVCETRIPEEKLRKLTETAGDYFLGDCLGEPDGIVCWQEDAPKRHLRGGPLQKARNLREAKNNYVRLLKKKVAFNKSLGLPGTLAVGGAPFHSYEYEGGVDICLTEMVPDHAQISLAETRGAAGAYGKRWGAHIAHYGYGGLISEDPLKLRRFNIALFEAFLAGAEFDYLETGAFIAHWRGESSAAGKRLTRWYRTQLRSFNEFTQRYKRPAHGPMVKVAVMRGNLDGWHGDEFGNSVLWGQFDRPEWQYGDPERGWDYLARINKKCEWDWPYSTGKLDLTGHFPLGQYDIIPPETPLDKMKDYSCLLFLGWNSMTSEMYARLKRYVNAGGHLVMSVPQLSTSVSLNGRISPVNGGDVRDLFGCRILGKGKTLCQGIRFSSKSSIPGYRFPVTGEEAGALDAICDNGPVTYARIGITSATPLAFADCTCFQKQPLSKERPILVENKVGKGTAFLITTWDYPGSVGMHKFMDVLLRTALIGEQDTLRVAGSDRLRCAVYVGKENAKPGKARTTIYILNTDFDNPQHALVVYGNRKTRVAVGPCAMAVVTVRKGVVESSKHVDLKGV